MPDLVNDEPQVVILGNVKEDGSPDIADVLFEFPVPHRQMRVRQEVRIDEVEVPGRSGKVKQAVGYRDSEIELTLDLLDDETNDGVLVTAREKLEAIQAAFRNRDDDGLPRMFSISSPLTDSCGIRTVLFRSLEVEDIPGDTALRVRIGLVEFEPISVQVERNASRAKAAAKARDEAKAAAEKQARQSGAAEVEEHVGSEDPLAAAYRQGKKDAMGGQEP